METEEFKKKLEQEFFEKNLKNNWSQEQLNKTIQKLNEISKQYNELNIKTIGEIIQINPEFEIPDYQRGYKWTQTQVQDLLNDFEAFFEKYKDDNVQYCLQPVIVKNKENNKIHKKKRK